VERIISRVEHCVEVEKMALFSMADVAQLRALLVDRDGLGRLADGLWRQADEVAAERDAARRELAEVRRSLARQWAADHAELTAELAAARRDAELWERAAGDMEARDRHAAADTLEAFAVHVRGSGLTPLAIVAERWAAEVRAGTRPGNPEPATPEPAADPTHGRIDLDIQDAVDEMRPTSLAQRVAIENTLQDRRRRGRPLDLPPDRPEQWITTDPVRNPQLPRREADDAA
jgi:hypothetical protein